MKSQNGITLMILVITIIAMSIIVGTISYNSINSFRMNAYYNMCADIELLDEKIALYYLEHKEEEESLPITDEFIEISDFEAYSEATVNHNPNNDSSGKLYKIDLSQLENLTLTSTKYYIDKQSHTIYTSHGKKVDGTVYYTVPLDYKQVNRNDYKQ